MSLREKYPNLPNLTDEELETLDTIIFCQDPDNFSSDPNDY